MGSSQAVLVKWHFVVDLIVAEYEARAIDRDAYVLVLIHGRFV